jgi:hypothetical protein
LHSWVALIDTLSIYEQFRASLGEERAKQFAQTPGRLIEEAKNAATKDDIRSLRETIERIARSMALPQRSSG